MRVAAANGEIERRREVVGQICKCRVFLIERGRVRRNEIIKWRRHRDQCRRYTVGYVDVVLVVFVRIEQTGKTFEVAEPRGRKTQLLGYLAHGRVQSANDGRVGRYRQSVQQVDAAV